MRIAAYAVALAVLGCLADPAAIARGNDGQPAPLQSPPRFSGWLGIVTNNGGAPRALPNEGTPFPNKEEKPDHRDWYGDCLGVPTFNWGYFGVKGRAYSVSHGSYYHDYQEWGVRRGY